MVTEFRSGLMEHAMKENGKRIRLMEKESSGMLMAMSSMENGWTIKLMGMGCIHTLMEQNTKDIGEMTYSMDMGLKLGQTDLGMRGTIRTGRNMEREHILGVMALGMLETGTIIK